MNRKIKYSIVGGIKGTTIMSIVMMISPMMGMPKMSPPEMLSGMLGISVFVGWIIHFMIGIIFAFAYTYLCIFKQKISNVWIKGAVFGIIAFVFAQLMMAIMGTMVQMPKMEGSKILTMIGSLLGHIIFGLIVSKSVGLAYCSNKSCETKTT